MAKQGDRIGPYFLVERLGRGAFGAVWLAEKRSAIFTSRVALKLPNDDDVDLEAVRREAHVWARAAGHPNVLLIIDADVYDEQVVIVSEYAPDGTLSSWTRRHGGKAPSVESAARLVAGILDGLAHLHSQSIIHRDLKPDNILMQGDTPRLADFGIARVLKTTAPYSTMVSGTPQYMAPEAYKGRRSEQTDLWSVGVIFYQLVAGSSPFPQEDPAAVMFAVLTEPPAPLPASTPDALRAVITRALEKDPSRRYRSAADMRSAVEGFLRGQPPPPDPPPPGGDDDEEDEGDIPTVIMGGVARVDEPVVAIIINRQYPRAVNDPYHLYQATRSMWRINRERANRARYAFAVYKGEIKEVYEVERWIPATEATRAYWREREQQQGEDFRDTHDGRSEFIGKLAPQAIRDKYVGKRVPFKPGQSPIRYINCKV